MTVDQIEDLEDFKEFLRTFNFGWRDCDPHSEDFAKALEVMSEVEWLLYQEGQSWCAAYDQAEKAWMDSYFGRES